MQLTLILNGACAAGLHIALDGDMLAQFLQLPTHVQQRLSAAMHSQAHLQHAGRHSQSLEHVPLSLQQLTRVVEDALPVV